MKVTRKQVMEISNSLPSHLFHVCRKLWIVDAIALPTEFLVKIRDCATETDSIMLGLVDR